MKINLVFTVVAKFQFCNTVATVNKGRFLVIIGKYYSLVGYFFSLTLNIEGQFLYTGLRRPIFY